MDALSNLGNFFSEGTGKGLLDVLKLGTAGAGLVGNIMNERARSQQLGEIRSAEKTLADPAALAKEVRAATEPLSAGLVQNVGEAVEGSLAERGLSQAPGIARTELSTALAPFEQANQNTALQLVLTRLGMPLEYAKAYLDRLPPNVNLAPLLALLGRGGGGTETDPETLALYRYLASPPFLPGQETTTMPAEIPPELGADMGDFSVPSDVFA